MAYDKAEDSGLQETVLNAIKEAKEEIALTRTAADDLINGLGFLKGLSKEHGGFGFTDVLLTGNSDAVFRTTLVGKNTADALSLTVNALGEIKLSDQPAASNHITANHGATAMSAAQDDPDAFEEASARYEAETGRAMDADIETNAAPDETLAETDVNAVLKDIAKRAVFQGRVSSTVNYQGVAATAAQKAVLDGIREAAEEKELARSAAADLVEGLEFLKRQSEGRFDFDTREAIGNSDVVIKTKPPQGQYRSTNLTVDAPGKIKVNDGYSRDAIYDGLNTTDVATLVKDLAKTAGLDRQVPLLSDDHELAAEQDLNFAEKAAIEGLREASDEITQTRMSGEGFIRGLEQLSKANVGFSFDVGNTRGSSEVVLTTKLPKEAGAVAPLSMTVDTSGKIKFNTGAEFDGLNKADVKTAVADVTRRAVFNRRTVDSRTACAVTVRQAQGTPDRYPRSGPGPF